MKNKLLMLILTFVISSFLFSYPVFRSDKVSLSEVELQKNNAQIEKLLSVENLFQVTDEDVVAFLGFSSPNEVKVMRILMEEQFKDASFMITKIEYRSNTVAAVSYESNVKNLSEKDYNTIIKTIGSKFKQKYGFNISEISKKSSSKMQEQLYLKDVFSITADVAHTEITKIKTYKRKSGFIMLSKTKNGWDISNQGVGMSFGKVYKVK
ncbi:hypothetical protein [Leptotrichia sp. oral taxon 223]|uniref:hypothetical protein n=1 Tax=Leptotrichia sp. oral taxon 223 TaxID=712363 RepID=UPI0015BBF1EA|nr:hypothetical protein [Leptotrichia sp. oral taxon 223]NWO18727.1 hypothetical protein [Leptotrichia sp. oral taxon 223]